MSQISCITWSGAGNESAAVQGKRRHCLLVNFQGYWIQTRCSEERGDSRPQRRTQVSRGMTLLWVLAPHGDYLLCIPNLPMVKSILRDASIRCHAGEQINSKKSDIRSLTMRNWCENKLKESLTLSVFQHMPHMHCYIMHVITEHLGVRLLSNCQLINVERELCF
jgi:hypothetical protein